MSIGIGYLLRDVTFLVADGRTRIFDRPGQPIFKDDDNKIFQIGPSVGAVTFGFSDVSDPTTRMMQSALKSDSTPEEILELAMGGLEKSWRSFAPRLPTGTDITDPHISAGLLVGGHADGSHFILSANRHYDGRNYSAVSRKVGDALFMCAENDLAGDVFDARLAQNGTPEDRQYGVGFDTLMRSFWETIRQMGFRDPYIGGIMRYAIIDGGGRYQTGIYHPSA